MADKRFKYDSITGADIARISLDIVTQELKKRTLKYKIKSIYKKIYKYFKDKKIKRRNEITLRPVNEFFELIGDLSSKYDDQRYITSCNSNAKEIDKIR